MAGSGSVHICKRIIACWAVILVSLMATAPLAQDLSRLPNVVDKVAASVVSITVEQPADAQKPGSKPQHQIGSGIILSPDGFIATVASLLQGGGSVTVALADGTQMVAAVVGSDARSNIAI
jgi:S1-C subfamily serine protease